jgi:RNase adapter protein RapZ
VGIGEHRGMSKRPRPARILLVSGMSGAGKTTTLKTLEDLGWEVVDNLPISMLDRLLATPTGEGMDSSRPLALGVDSRTRGFDASAIVHRIKLRRDDHGENIATLFLDCAGAELERRYSETRRRHPLAPDRPASDGIARERELVAPLRRWADHVIDTSATSSNDLRLDLRDRFAIDRGSDLVLSVMSFGYARGIPRNADLVFDMRFLRNPHWDEKLRPGTGLDADVGAFVRADPAWDASVNQIRDLLKLLIPRYKAEGKAYLTIAFGCTGGRHRSVHVAEFMTEALRESGYALSLVHRDVNAAGSGAEVPQAEGNAPTG